MKRILGLATIIFVIICLGFTFASCSVSKVGKHTVSFDVNGGVMPGGSSSSVSVANGNTVSLPIPTREGYTFEGWYTGDSAVDGAFIASDAVFSNLKLVARWRANKLTVTFVDYNGLVLDTQKVDYGTAANAPEAPMLISGKKLVFSGWDKDISRVTEDMKVKAVYLANNHTISFVTNCDTALADVTLTYGDVADKPADLSLPGNAFFGWYLDPNFTQRYYFNYPLNEDSTLYARFYPNTDGEYSLISTPEDLSAIASNPSGKYLLVGNIDFRGGVWTPIADFSGELNGNGYTISNIVISETGARVGFIINNFGTVKDLSFDSVSYSVASTEKNNYCGVVCAQNDGTVENCHILEGSIFVSSDVSVSGNSTDSVRIGALIGFNRGRVISCSNSAGISVSVSGYISNKYDLNRDPFVGGLVGHNDTAGVITRSSNTGALTVYFKVNRWSSNSTVSDMEPRVGGLVGINYGTIDQCASSQDIVHTNNVSSGRLYSRTGGFVGYNYGQITNSYSEGSVSGEGTYDTSYLGGFVGINAGIVNNCYSTANVYDKSSYSANGVGGFAGLNEIIGGYNASISNCFCTGSVNMVKKAVYYGAFVGKINSNAPFFACYYLDTSRVIEGEEDITPESTVSSVITAEELLDARFLGATLYFDNGIWKISDGKLPELLAVAK